VRIAREVADAFDYAGPVRAGPVPSLPLISPPGATVEWWSSRSLLLSSYRMKPSTATIQRDLGRGCCKPGRDTTV
jgi:hypothetical protein